MEIKDIITSILAALIFNLLFGSGKERKATRKRLHSILVQINSAMETPRGRTLVNSLVVLLIICSAVLGALNLSISVQENKPLWLCILAPFISVGSVLPLAAIIYRQRA
jgi:hypothetical protein